MAEPAHVVRQLWIRAREGGPMEPRERLELVADQGIRDDHTFGRMRHVTIVFEDDWKAATDQLGRDVDPAGRRANVLISGGGGGALIGSTIRLGPALVRIKGETVPCPVMDQAAEGLREALAPDTRAGVWGRVVEGGELAIGDGLTVEQAPEPAAD